MCPNYIHLPCSTLILSVSILVVFSTVEIRALWEWDRGEVLGDSLKVVMDAAMNKYRQQTEC